MKLEPEHKHILKLIRRDSGHDGWTKVSDALYPHLTKNMPSELVEFCGNVGTYKAKLTKKGQDIILAMEWL